MPSLKSLMDSRLSWALLLWTGMSAVLTLLSVQIFGRFPLVPALLQILHPFVAALVLLICVLKAITAETDGLVRRYLVIGGATLLIAAGFFFGSPLLKRASLWMEFQRVRPAYEQVVAQAEAGRTIPRQRTPDGAYPTVDLGPPVRVAFNWGGLADNWHGIVHDPTEIVRTARGWGPDQHLTVAPEAQELFGGDIVRCTQLARGWFYCGFT